MTCSQSWCPHVTVSTVVEKNGKFLVVEEIAGGQQVINQPAGHLDDNESFIAAAIRETLEETAWTVKPTHICGVYRWRHPDNQQTFVRISYAATATSHDPSAALDNGIIAAHWYSREELVQRTAQLRSPMVLTCIDDFLAGKNYPLELIQDVL